MIYKCCKISHLLLFWGVKIVLKSYLSGKGGFIELIEHVFLILINIFKKVIVDIRGMILNSSDVLFCWKVLICNFFIPPW